MLNSHLKKQALSDRQRAEDRYNQVFQRLTEDTEDLYTQRLKTATQTIQACEDYINTLANSPKEFDKSVANFRAEYQQFAQRAKEIEIEARKHIQVSGSVVGAGVVAGTGVAALGPTAAMAIATTFGTASTGTAISTLSGAAATNAALAWLGGGTLAAGGGGMTAGSTLLAFAGPIGWAICGVGLAGGAFLASQKNAETAEKATKETIKIKQATQQLVAAGRQIDQLIQLTQTHADGVSQQLQSLINEAPNDYRHFTQPQKETLAALINNLQSLSKLLNTPVCVGEQEPEKESVSLRMRLDSLSRKGLPIQ